MSKRTDAIRSLFVGPQSPVLSADNVGAGTRVSSGAVRSLRGSFSDAERENEELRQKLSSGSHVVEIDPGLIDPSPVADRFEEQDAAAYQALKSSIAQRGQEVPVLLRAHPTEPGRYQSAYGHRRIRVARELARPVKAVLRPLSDEDLVVAQGVENSAREDLSFIERAVFATRLEDAGHDRSVVQEALAIDRAEASKLVAVGRAVPSDLLARIGRAPKVGRGRWQALAELLRQSEALTRARAVSNTSTFSAGTSDQRFIAVLQAAGIAGSDPDAAPAADGVVASKDGRQIATVHKTGRDVRIVVSQAQETGFATFLINQLPSLFESYTSNKPKGHREA